MLRFNSNLHLSHISCLEYSHVITSMQKKLRDPKFSGNKWFYIIRNELMISGEKKTCLRFKTKKQMKYGPKYVV